MPDDLVSSLEVKFGGLGFGLADTKTSFTATPESEPDGFSSAGQSATAATEQQPLAPLSSPSQPAKVGRTPPSVPA